jgi:Ca2+-binding EF-hand superfamily protein
MVVFFIFFIAVASFGFLNIVVGIVVESTLRTSEADDNKIKRAQERDRQRVFDHLREIFEAADEDGSGTLTLGEVEKAINKPEIYNKLKMIEFPVEDPRQIFELLDYDNTGELSIDEFINGCIGMKGTAKSKDLLAAQVAVDTMKRHYLFFENEMKELQGKIALLDDTARALVYQGEHVFLNLREYRMRHPELEGGIASPPRVDTAAMHSAPWESGAKPLSIDDAKKQDNQAAIWDDAFNKPASDEWAVVPIRPETASEFMANSREGFGSLNNIDSSKCYYCMAPMVEGKKFCTACGKERVQALTNGNAPPALMNSANNSQPALMNSANNSSNSRRVQVQTTDLAIPGSM